MTCTNCSCGCVEQARVRGLTSDSSWLYDALWKQQKDYKELFGDYPSYAIKQEMESNLKKEIFNFKTVADAVTYGKKYDVVAGHYNQKLWPEQRQQSETDAHPGGY